MILHAGLVALRLGDRWRGVLIEGPSGAGKSDLALRLLERGWRLAADDRTLVFLSRGRLFGKAPAPLRGLIEARGLGVLRAPALAFAEIALTVACAADAGEIERLPAPLDRTLLGLALPAVRLAAREASAPAKLCRVVEDLSAPGQQGYDAAFAPAKGARA